jgi:hypothetical protein
MATHSQPLPSRSRLGDRASSLAAAVAAPYWLLMAGIYGGYGFLWYYSAKGKLIDESGTMPAAVARTFQGTFLDSVPGLDAAWVILGVLEAVAVVLFAASLLAGEFLPQRRKPVLMLALGLSIATFAAMVFAESMAGATATVGSVFTYLTGTVVVMAVVAALTPERVRALAAALTGHDGR